MDVRIEKLRCCDMQEQGLDLLEANAAETGHRELDVDWSSYYRAEARHNLLMFGAWAEEKLIGYVIGFYLDNHPQHAGWAHVHVDALFVHPDYRARSPAAVQLMATMSRAAKGLRATSVLWAAKVGTGFEHALDSHGRYRKVETIYEEQL